MKNRVEIKMKFPAKFNLSRTLKVGFRFTHFALFTAMDVTETEPHQFEKLPPDEQLAAVAYGAAIHDAMKTGKRFKYDYATFRKALDTCSLNDGKKLGQAWAYAETPKWMREAQEEVVKKKSPKTK